MKSALKDQSGFGLIEVTVAAAILGVIALGMATMMKQQGDQISALRLSSTRDNIKNLSDRYVSDSVAIATSIDVTLPLKFPNASDLGNQLLDRCRNGNPPLPTLQCGVHEKISAFVGA